MGLIIRVVILSMFFAGCGDNNGFGNYGYGNNPIFPKNAVMAEATIENAKQIQEIVTQDHTEIYDTRMATKDRGQSIGLIMKDINDIARKNISLGTNESRETLNSREECYNGGYRTMKASGGEVQGITGELDFENCESHGKKIDGKVSVSAYGREANLNGFKYADTRFLSDVYISKDGVTRKILKGSSTKKEYVSIDLQGKKFWGMKMTINSVVEINNIKTAQENVTYDMFLFYALSKSVVKGRIYINNLASYIDYDTSYNIPKNLISTDSSGFVFAKGENRYRTTNGGNIKFSVHNNKRIIYIDNDGDGIYELNKSQ